MNQNYYIISLDKFHPYASLNFTKAFVPKTLDSPIITVMYELDKEEQEYGIRLDVDKQVFIDHPFGRNSVEEKNATEKAANIALFVAKQIAALREKHHIEKKSSFRRPIWCTE